MLSADSDGDQVQTGWMESNGFEAEEMLFLVCFFKFIYFLILFVLVGVFFVHCLHVNPHSFKVNEHPASNRIMSV